MDEQEFKLYELYLRIQTLESSVAAILWPSVSKLPTAMQWWPRFWHKFKPVPP